MSLGNRINEIRKEKGISIDELCARSGVPKGTLSKITADITTNPTLDTVRAIAIALNCRLDDFDDSPNANKNTSLGQNDIEHLKKYHSLDPHGIKVVDFVLEEEYSRSISIKEAAGDGDDRPTIIASIPYAYDLAASAGVGEYAMDIAHFETVGLTEPPPRGADFLIRIDGDSMEPKYSHGDKVYIKRQDAVNEGEIGLFYLDGNVYIKKQGYDELISLNPKYDPIPVSEYSTSKCFGMVLGKCDGNIIEL